MGQAKRRGTFEQRLEMALVKKYQPLNQEQKEVIKEIASKRIDVIGLPHRTPISLALMLAALYPPYKI